MKTDTEIDTLPIASFWENFLFSALVETGTFGSDQKMNEICQAAHYMLRIRTISHTELVD